MCDSLAFLFCLIAPPVAVCAGGLIVRLWRPGPRMQAAVQPFTAGLVLGAVAIELAPEFVASPHAVEVVIGFAIGAAMMLVVARLTHGAEDTQSGSSLSLFAAVAVDLFVDGLLVGTSFAVGAKQGVLVAIALAGCGFFLTITTATSFQSRGISQGKTAIITAMLMLITIAGVFLAHLFSTELVGGLRSGTLAFATAALLYLVAEELMTEAHQAAEDRPATPALFFTGFLLVYLLQRMLG